MRRPAKILLGAAAAVAALLLAAAIAVPLLVDAEALRPRAESKLSEVLGRKVSLGRASLSLWTGLALRADGLRIGEPTTASAAGAPILEARRTSVRLAMLPLLRRRIEARSIAIEGATILQDGKPLLSELSLTSTLRVEPDGAVGAAGRLSTRVDLLAARPRVEARFATRLAGGVLDLPSVEAIAGPARIEARGRVEGVSTRAPRARLDLKVSLARSSLSGPLDVTLEAGAPNARFDLASPRLDLGELAELPEALSGAAARSPLRGVELTGVTAVATMDHGVVRLQDTRFEVFEGTGAGTATARPFETARPFSVDQQVEGVAIGALIAALAPAQKGAVEGRASLGVTLQGHAGEASLLPSLSGSGTLSIRDGSIKSAGVIQQVMKLLETAGAKGVAKSETPFDRLTAEFTVRDGVATTRNLEFRSPDLDFDGQGAVGLGGALKLDVLGSFSKEISAQLTGKTPALAMRVNDAGRLTVPLQIRGTLQAPRVQLDLEKIISEGVVKKLKQDGTRGLLKQLLGR